VNHRQRLLTAAIDEKLGHTVSSGELIRMALEALMADIDTPALRQLAGFTRSEEADAHDLFEQVIHELGLAPSLPDHPTEARWALVRWWCQLTVNGELPPQVLGQLTWEQAWDKLRKPSALQPLVSWFDEWDDWNIRHNVPRETYLEHILAEARQLLDGPWPPEDNADAHQP
jgi:hypothetical protein